MNTKTFTYGCVATALLAAFLVWGLPNLPRLLDRGPTSAAEDLSSNKRLRVTETVWAPGRVIGYVVEDTATGRTYLLTEGGGSRELWPREVKK